MKFFGQGKKGQSDEKEEKVLEIDLAEIEPNPYQPRSYFNPESIEELAHSINEFGIIQPVVVRKQGDKYELIAGERRFRAFKLLERERIPAIVKELTDRESSELALTENLQREDLNYFEEAEGYRRLQDEFGLTQEEIAKKFFKGQSTIANKLRLLKLSPRVRRAVSPSVITERHVRALLLLESEEDQLQALDQIYLKKLNVRQSEELIATMKNGTAKKKKPRIKSVVQDMRIFLNTIREAVEMVKTAGMPAEVSEIDGEDYYEVVIKLPKKRE